MDRSHRTRAVYVVVAVTGLCWCLLGPGSAFATAKEHIITVNEPGQAGLRCRLLKTWTEPDGGKAYLVQAVDTQELITVVDSEGVSRKTPAAGEAISMHIYHWLGTTPPPEAPMPPSSARVFGQATNVPASSKVPVATKVPAPGRTDFQSVL